jgi:hypothetical protein
MLTLKDPAADIDLTMDTGFEGQRASIGHMDSRVFQLNRVESFYSATRPVRHVVINRPDATHQRALLGVTIKFLLD